MEIKLTHEQEIFLTSNSSRVKGDIGDWYYIPFWFEKLDNGNFKMYSFDDLPDKFIKRLNKLRNNE